MPVYQYRGRRYDSGSEMTGKRFAVNEQSLATALRAEKIMPISIKEKGTGILSKEISLPGLGSGVSAKELALFTRQFSVMLNAGLPLVQCLEIIANQQVNKIFRSTLHDVRQDVEAGSTLAEAMRQSPKVFDTLFVNMIAAGEAAGILDVILNRLSTFMEKIVKLKRALVSALIYPLIIILVATIIVVVIMLWVVPTFATLFEGLNAPLPLPTRMVILISSMLGQLILPVLLLVVLSVVGLRYAYGTDRGRLIMDRILLAIPVLGGVLQKIAVARFSRTLSTLLASGITILEGLVITARTAGNKLIENALLQARKEVEGGKTLADPLRKFDFFPPMVIQMIGVGEQTGELDQMLEKLADYYEEEADAAIATLLTMLEPIMIVFLGGVIGGIVISMYLPIFTLIRHLSG